MMYWAPVTAAPAASHGGRHGAQCCTRMPRVYASARPGTHLGRPPAFTWFSQPRAPPRIQYITEYVVVDYSHHHRSDLVAVRGCSTIQEVKPWEQGCWVHKVSLSALRVAPVAETDGPHAAITRGRWHAKHIQAQRRLLRDLRSALIE